MTSLDADLHCPLCGEEKARLRFEQAPHRVQDCAGCGVTYVSPRRTGRELIEEVYDESYWRSNSPSSRGYADYAGDAALHERTYGRRLQVLEKRLPRAGRVLDVGCAEGSFLQLMQNRGWSAFGLEPSPSMAQLACARIGEDRIQTASLDRARFDSECFDLITLWDVLEHLPAPIEGLQRVREWLSPQGRVLIETQDISSLMARVCGARWQHFKHDEHLVHFTPATLESACRKAGLRLIHTQRRGAGKYVRGAFLVERSARIHRRWPGLLRPFLGGDWSVYVNPLDEIIAIAEPLP